AVTAARPLKDGDLIDFSGTPLKFVDPAEIYLRKLSAGPDDAGSSGDVAVLRLPSEAERGRAAKVDRQATTRNETEGRARLERTLIIGGLAIAFAAIAALVWVLAT